MAEPKKQVPLRLNAKLYDALAAWAEDDFRSVNGQIEYLRPACGMCLPVYRAEVIPGFPERKGLPVSFLYL